MKKKRILSFVMACSLICSVPVSGEMVSRVTEPELSQVSAAKKVRKRWFTTKSGKKKYYVNGEYVTGLRKIKKYTYFFNKKGIMQTGTVTVKKTTYYLDEKGHLEARKVRNTYYDAKGKKMSTAAAEDFKTLQTAKSIVKQCTTSGMSNAEKLKACFSWVMAKPYRTYRTFVPSEGWPALYANDHFLRGGGNCFSDGAAFAYLAKAIGYDNVYVCVDCDGSGGRGHCWAEIDGLVYDPLFAQAKSYSGNYGVPYGTYKLSAIIHLKL